jgi:mono/diheme cytochrome c family protein
MKLSILTVAAGIVIACILGSCNKKNEGEMKTSDSTKQTSSASMSPVERGRYLVTAVAGCGDCHTPWKMGAMGPEPDMTRMLAGNPEAMTMPPPPKMNMPWMATISASFTSFAGPWGISYAANLTPDSATGLGKWTEADFIKSLRSGIYIQTGRPLLPPMPWPSFKNMTDDDLKAIFAYLRSIPAVHNQVPAAMINMPPPGAGGPSGAPPASGGAMKGK